MAPRTRELFLHQRIELLAVVRGWWRPSVIACGTRHRGTALPRRRSRRRYLKMVSPTLSWSPRFRRRSFTAASARRSRRCHWSRARSTMKTSLASLLQPAVAARDAIARQHDVVVLDAASRWSAVASPAGSGGRHAVHRNCVDHHQAILAGGTDFQLLESRDSGFQCWRCVPRGRDSGWSGRRLYGG